MRYSGFIFLPLFLAIPLLGADALSFIEVDPGSRTALRARDTHKPVVAVGVNYFSPHIGWAPKLWQQFNEDTVRGHLTMLADHGYNAIRVFLTYESFHRDPGQVHAEGEARFRKLLSMCQERGIYVMPSGPDHWEGTPEWRRGANPYADERILQADEAWWSAFVARFKDEPAILAWDLYNEPSIPWESAGMPAGWNDWLAAKYKDVQAISAAWNRPVSEIGELGKIAIPPTQPARGDRRLLDYQRFREHVADTWTRRITTAIRKGDPNHLITIGHIQWASPVFLPSVWHYAAFDLDANARHVDFVTIHFYPLAAPWPSSGAEGIAINRRYLEALLAECSRAGKPVMLGEFAWYGGGDLRVGDKVQMPYQSVEEQVAWCQALLEVTSGRVCGWLHWAMADTPTSTDLTRWSGLWTEDLQIKPWGRLYSEFAQKATAAPVATQPYREVLRKWPCDREELLTDPAATSECLNRLGS